MTMAISRWVASVFVLPMLSGCNALPTVAYTKIELPKEGNTGANMQSVTDSFFLPASEIVIDRVVETKDKVEKVTFTVSSRPIESREYKVGVRPDDNWGVKTKINITKRENTDLVASIGVDTVDERKKLVEATGAAVVKTISLAAALAPEPGKGPPLPCIADSEFPVVIVLTKQALSSASSLTFGPDGQQSQTGCISVTLEPLPPDRLTQIPWDTATHNYYYSACRDAVIRVNSPSSQNFAKTVRVADPNAVQFVQLPYKGSVTAHSQCGVSVKTEAVASDVSTVEVIDAVAKATKDALDAANKK